MKASGGYLIDKAPLIRAGFNKHTVGLERPVSDVDLRALNAVQSTPWRINRFILEVMEEVWAAKLSIAGIVQETPSEVPPRLPDEVWSGMSEEDKKEHIARLRKIRDRNASIVGRSQALLDKLMVAQEMRSEPSIWFPHTKDFRGRIYPLPVAGPHPQSDDVGKALLMFASGLPLGPDGLFWLCIRAANTFGMDKLTLEERVAWALSNQEKIRTAAVTPLECSWWTSADEPWSFLATCHELTEALSLPCPEEFVSHLPVPMDGSCNGLQHLSAMGLDPVGASATNLRANAERQDVYEEVAKHVRAATERDAAAGVEAALAWHGKVTRSVVKRAVMTTPYGVTDRGIRTQLINDGHVPECDNEGDAADYLRDRIVEALGATIESGRAIMAWLQTTAHALSEAGIPFTWNTPAGSTCKQAYHVLVSRRVRTLCGRLELFEEGDTPLSSRKQALGSAPNYVHSFDAAHLALTVNACHEDGIRSFAMVHDSFGTHARNSTTLARILRETFVSIYRDDWLAKTAAEIKQYAPHVKLPPLPARGDFDIAEVLDAPFFFS